MTEKWKDHMTAQLVSELTECAKQFADTQQLRDRIRTIVVPVCERLKRAEEIEPIVRRGEEVKVGDPIYVASIDG